MSNLSPEMIFFALFALGTISTIVISLVVRSKNRAAFADFAREHDLTYEPTLSREQSEEIAPARYSRVTASTNHFHGKLGWTTVRIASIRNVTRSSSNSSSTTITTVGAVPYSGPRFVIKPMDPKRLAQQEEGREKFELAAEKLPFLGALMDRFAVPEPIEVADHVSGFSDSWQVTGDDEERVKEAVGRPLQEFAGSHRPYSIESNGSWLLLYRESRRLPRDEYAAFLDALKELDRAREEGAVDNS